MSRHILISIIALVCAVVPCRAIKVADVPNVHLTDRTRFVTDMPGVLSAAERARTDSMLSHIWQTTSAEPVVVIVQQLDGEDENDFATALFTDWGIGKGDKDNGLLLLVSINDRRIVIRTGYGLEGLVPDILASKIIRNEMTPSFRRGRYGDGIINAVSAIAQATGSEEARAELMSKYGNDSRAGEASDADEAFRYYLIFAAVLAAIALAIVLVTWIDAKGKPTAEAYGKFQKTKLGLAVIAVFTLGMGLPALLLALFAMRRIRLRKRHCPHCHTRMQRVDEDNDNLYLTHHQDTEERLNSVDYDVWLCPACGETDIIPYVNPRTAYTVCPHCKARAATLVNRRTIHAPTTTREGRGEEIYSCLNCSRQWNKPYRIAKVAAPPVVIIPGGGRGGNGFGGGGFSGGSFGGGMTGGGGASGGW